MNCIKRPLLAALSLLLALSIAGCAGSAPAATEPSTEPSAVTAPSATETGPSQTETQPPETTLPAPTEPEPTDPEPADPQEQIDALRSGLTERSFQVLTFYLAEGFEAVDEDPAYACYTTDTVTLRAKVMPSADLGEGITDMAGFADAYCALLGAEGTTERREHLGQTLIVYSDGAATTVTGLYMLEDTLGILEITTDQFAGQESLLLDYAALAQLTGKLEPPKVIGSLGAISVELAADFLPGYQSDAFVNYYNENISVTISLETPGPEITAAVDMIADFIHTQRQYWTDIEAKTHGYVPYVICTGQNSSQCLMVGFYLSGGTAWTITAESFRPKEYRTDLIEIVTGGIIDSQAQNALPQSQTVTCEGLSLQIGKQYTIEESPTGVTCYCDGTTLTLICNTPDSFPMAFASSAEMAQFYASQYAGQWELIQVTEQETVSYVIYQNANGYTRVTGCYVSGSTSWELSGYGYWSATDLEAMIQTITSGQIL